jgi:probable F420-dependent oxidoreductase
VTVEAVLPYWLDRSDEEALGIARQVERAGLGALWVGEMATFDAGALATAIGDRTERLALRIGPLAVGVRSPVAVALAASSVATLTGHPVDVALGASSPGIVAGWHGRPWEQTARRMRETIECLRPILRGERADYDGDLLRSHGFRLRRPVPEARIWAAAFGPAMTRVAARHADGVLLNLVSPDHVREVSQTVAEEADRVGRTAPPLAVWVPAAIEPAEAARAQLAGQLAVYLAPPGYGEMFSSLGFAELVKRARGGARRAELAADIPLELAEQVGAIGSAEHVAERIAAYHQAGADVVGVVPSTAEDPDGKRVLEAAATGAGSLRTGRPGG